MSGTNVTRCFGPGDLDSCAKAWFDTWDINREPWMGSCGMTYLIAGQLRLRALLADLLNREEGQDMIEYALLAALISIVAIAIIVLVGPYLKDLFQDVVNGLDSA